MDIKRISILTMISLFFSGCVTLTGPDQEYVLTEEGFEEVKKTANPATHEASRSTSDNQTTASTVRQRGSNLDEAFGSCYRNGLEEDPDPWTSFEFVINKDIDVAYPRIMREFGYIRLETVYHYATHIPICDIHSRYVEVPGSHYQMRNFIKHSCGNEESENTIEVDLSKEDVGKVRVRVSYYSGNTIDSLGYEASLKKRIEKALR